MVDPPVNPLPAAKCAYPPVPVDPIPVANRRVLVIGGAKGIGKVTAQYLSERGFNVIATSSHLDCYLPLPPGTKYTLSQQALDVRTESCVNDFFDKVIRPLGSLDAMIFLPGIHGGGLLHDYTGDDLRNASEVKIFGFQRCAKAAIPYLRNGINPRVLCVSSIGGGESYFGFGDPAYAIAYHAIVMQNDNLMLEERILYGSNQISNPITFTIVEGQPIKSTIGLYQLLKSSSRNIDDRWVNYSMTFFGALQSNGLASFGVPVSEPIYAAIDFYNILIAKQPAVRYLMGDPLLTIPGPTGPLHYPEFLQYVNTISQDDLLNTYIIPQAGVLVNTPTINLLKSITYSIYFT